MKPAWARSWTTMETLPGRTLSSSLRTANYWTSGTWWEREAWEVWRWWPPLRVSAQSRPGGPRRRGRASRGAPAAPPPPVTVTVSSAAASPPESQVGGRQTRWRLPSTSLTWTTTASSVGRSSNRSLYCILVVLPSLKYKTSQIGLESEAAARIFRFCDSVRSQHSKLTDNNQWGFLEEHRQGNLRAVQAGHSVQPGATGVKL